MKKELAVSMNKYLANIGVEYIKLHHLHWNVVGVNFKSIHEYLEGLYDGLASSLDEVAELLKIHDEVPAASLKEYLELASIEELEAGELHGKEVLEIVLKDFKEMRNQAEALRNQADEEHLFGVVSALEGDLEQYDKNIWFIKAMLK
ncbi:MAG: DNA starvation/stationary phase protection protein [Erysipelotrichaceae bacterium]|nr:DNA starvation/stationary phase protection protein [Erysipelotrichaceae bacterium]MBQ4342599.1 DNA starvation/stationary phase protection protein [Erysipelotrichaceae bacterium]